MMRPAGVGQAVRAAGMSFSRDAISDRLENPDIEVSDRKLAWAGRAAALLNHRPAGRQLAAGISLPLVPLEIEDPDSADRPVADQPADSSDGITVYDIGRALVLDTPVGPFLAVAVPIVTEEQVEQAVAQWRQRRGTAGRAAR
jgi:hypothetical protein